MIVPAVKNAALVCVGTHDRKRFLDINTTINVHFPGLRPTGQQNGIPSSSIRNRISNSRSGDGRLELPRLYRAIRAIGAEQNSRESMKEFHYCCRAAQVVLLAVYWWVVIMSFYWISADLDGRK